MLCFPDVGKQPPLCNSTNFEQLVSPEQQAHFIMARSSRPSNPTAVSSSKKSGKSDYAQRHSNARKNRKTKTAEVYEYAAEKTRRSNVGLDLDREEAEGAGFGGGDESRDEMRARLIGEHEDGERIDSADDEELDSDAAFEESDEDRFAGFFSKKVCSHIATIRLDWTLYRSRKPHRNGKLVSGSPMWI